LFTTGPSQAALGRIIQYVTARAARIPGWEAEPCRIQAAVQLSGVDVSADQVAWVLVTYMRVSG
jgi:hypothetical protein